VPVAPALHPSLPLKRSWAAAHTAHTFQMIQTWLMFAARLSGFQAAFGNTKSSQKKREVRFGRTTKDGGGPGSLMGPAYFRTALNTQMVPGVRFII
jgi:hypothetical protein|tara:strand:+ start:115 stop:402 length:288 start_codon:yes stop_codon:yes gene_type:complete